MSLRRKSQSIIEYVMITIIATSAIAAMTWYLRRAMYARFSQVREELNESQR